MFRHHFDDQLGSNLLWLVRGDDILELLFRNLHGNLCFFQVGVGDQLVEGPLDFTDIGFDVFGYVI